MVLFTVITVWKVGTVLTVGTGVRALSVNTFVTSVCWETLSDNVPPGRILNLK